MFMLMVGEIPTKLHTLPEFGFELQPSELFDGL